MGNFAQSPAYILNGDMTAASVVGPWFYIKNFARVGFQVTWLGTGAPVGVWGADITSDDNPNAFVRLGPTPLTLSAAAQAQNPSGNSVAGNTLFEFNPGPTAGWIRFKYTRTSGGAVSALQVAAFAKDDR